MIISTAHFSQSQQSNAKIMRQFRKFFKLLSVDNIETVETVETVQKEKEKQKKMRMSVHSGSFVIQKPVKIVARLQNINTSLSSCHHESSFD